MTDIQILPIDFYVLVACEESQRVCTAFRKRGFKAFSCDIQEPSGERPVLQKPWQSNGEALKMTKSEVNTDGRRV